MKITSFNFKYLSVQMNLVLVLKIKDSCFTKYDKAFCKSNPKTAS